MTANLAAVFAIPDPERMARLREVRLASLLLLGRRHTVTEAATEAIADPEGLDALLTAIDSLEAIPRRRLLATLATVLPA